MDEKQGKVVWRAAMDPHWILMTLMIVMPLVTLATLMTLMTVMPLVTLATLMRVVTVSGSLT